jgi:hypothetical protein
MLHHWLAEELNQWFWFSVTLLRKARTSPAHGYEYVHASDPLTVLFYGSNWRYA